MFKDKKLLLAFAALILLTICVGIIGIAQVNNLSRKVQDLGERSLQLQKAVLEMRVNNTVFAMGVRNYVFWKISRYLGAVPVAVNLEGVFSAAQRFGEQLKIYENYAYLAQQKKWALQIKNSFNELNTLGRQLIEMIEKQKPEKLEGQINNKLMVFETRLYRIDDFLDNTMGKSNLKEIERQISRANSDKAGAVLFLFLIIAVCVFIGSVIAVFVWQRQKQERNYRQKLFNHMINLEENERRYLSAQVHDQLGQDLSALKISLGIIEQNLAGASADAKDRIEQSRNIITGLIDKSHNIAFLLRPPALDEVGLTESLEALLCDYKHIAGFNYIFNKPEKEFVLEPEYSLVLYRITQELLTNMLKHAQAKNVELRLVLEKNSVELFYRDDGKGFNYNEIIKRPMRRLEDRFKLGLLGLKERVELLDGLMAIDSSPGRGTRVTVKLFV